MKNNGKRNKLVSNNKKNGHPNQATKLYVAQNI